MAHVKFEFPLKPPSPIGNTPCWSVANTSSWDCLLGQWTMDVHRSQQWSIDAWIIFASLSFMFRDCPANVEVMFFSYLIWHVDWSAFYNHTKHEQVYFVLFLLFTTKSYVFWVSSPCLSMTTSTPVGSMGPQPPVDTKALPHCIGRLSHRPTRMLRHGDTKHRKRPKQRQSHVDCLL